MASSNLDDRPTLNIAVLTPASFSERLKVSFSAVAKTSSTKSKIECHVKLIGRIEDLLQDNQTSDYVALFVNTKERDTKLRFERYLTVISQKLVMTKLVVVNGSCRSGPVSVARELNDLAEEFRIPIVNAEVSDDASCQQVAETVIRLAKMVSGSSSRMPVVIPTPRDLKIFSRMNADKGTVH